MSTELVRKGDTVEREIGSEFWKILEEKTDELNRMYLDIAQMKPEHAQWYAGAAKATLDFLNHVRSCIAERDAFLDSARDNGAAVTPKSPIPKFRRVQPPSDI